MLKLALLALLLPAGVRAEPAVPPPSRSAVAAPNRPLEVEVTRQEATSAPATDDYRENLPVGEKAIGLAPLPPGPSEPASE